VERLVDVDVEDEVAGRREETEVGQVGVAAAGDDPADGVEARSAAIGSAAPR
jgi:hypothetical protein